ncbi:MAG: S8 family serine peptidase [Actinomycetota bacterium]|nr:S8 family serine peptidase [Actinomycetota bacterium]
MRPIAMRPLRVAVVLAVACTLIATFAAAPAGAEPTMQTGALVDRPDAPIENDGRHVIVQFEPNATGADRASAHSANDVSVVNRLEWANADVVRVASGSDPDEVARRYLRNPQVRSAEPNWLLRTASVPNDYFFQYQWNLHNTGQALYGGSEYGTADADIDLPEAFDFAFGAGNFPSTGGVRVGILDTGIDQDHEDLVGKTKACASAVTGTGIVAEGMCDDSHGHGTHISGIVAAHTHNWTGVAGVAPNADLAVVNVRNANGGIYYVDAIAGLRWLRTTGQARIVNMSFAINPGGVVLSLFNQELSEAYAAGTLLVAAAGNSGCYPCYAYPAMHPDVISVAATDRNDQDWNLSNCNDDVEIAAPGVRVGSTWPNNEYGEGSGTSLAAPHVTAVAALVMSERGTTAAQTRAILTSTADDLGPAGGDVCFGAGRVNALRALGGTPQRAPLPGVIKGTITDQSGKLLSGSVSCDSTYYDHAPEGFYEIRPIPAGSYSCTATASYGGYRSKTQQVTVSEGGTTTANFVLRKSGGK